MADRTTATPQSPLAEITKLAVAARDFFYGTKERAQRTIGLAYLVLALGMIMQSSAYHVVCAAY